MQEREKATVSLTHLRKIFCQPRITGLTRNYQIFGVGVVKRMDKENGNGEGKKKRAPVSKGRKESKDVRPVIGSSDCEWDADEWYCLIVLALYRNSRRGDVWIQCSGCGNRFLEECTGFGFRNLFLLVNSD